MSLTKVADIPQNILDIYSRELIMEQLPRLHFRNFVNVKTEAGLQPGEKIKFISLDELPSGGELTDEDTPITKHKISGGEVFITLKEFGNGAEFSRKAAAFSIRGLMEDAKTVLGRDYLKVIDAYLRDIFLTTANKWYALADGTSGANTAAVAGMFDNKTLDGVVERANNLNMPKLVRGADQFFAFIGLPRQIRQMRASTGWLNARQYVDASQMLNGEAGRLNDVIFLQTTQMPTLVGAGAAAEDVHRGIFIGDRAVGYGESIPMELIPGPIEDFGRKQSIAWYSILGSGIVNDFLIEVQTKNALT